MMGLENRAKYQTGPGVTELARERVLGSPVTQDLPLTPARSLQSKLEVGQTAWAQVLAVPH